MWIICKESITYAVESYHVYHIKKRIEKKQEKSCLVFHLRLNLLQLLAYRCLGSNLVHLVGLKPIDDDDDDDDDDDIRRRKR